MQLVFATFEGHFFGRINYNTKFIIDTSFSFDFMLRRIIFMHIIII